MANIVYSTIKVTGNKKHQFINLVTKYGFDFLLPMPAVLKLNTETSEHWNLVKKVSGIDWYSLYGNDDLKKKVLNDLIRYIYDNDDPIEKIINYLMGHNPASDIEENCFDYFNEKQLANEIILCLQTSGYCSWEEFRKLNWGTAKVYHIGYNEKEDLLFIDTAWTPPVSFLEHASETMGLTFECESWDPVYPEYVSYKIKNGKATEWINNTDEYIDGIYDSN
jgi:hypothetical protein